MSDLLRIGIIGLGPRWEKHYKPALRRLRERFQVRAVFDQVHERAVTEAKQLGCDAAAGCTELLTRADVQALLLLNGQWFGLWPLELACRLGKPVLCCGSLAGDDAHADALHRQIQESGIPVVMGLTPRFAAATTRLRHLLASRLGRPRLLLCEACQPPQTMTQTKVGQMTGAKPGPFLLGDLGIALVDWCLWLSGAEPQHVLATGNEDLKWGTLVLECADGQYIQITCHRAAGLRRAFRLRVIAERGSATVELPDGVSWTSRQSEYSQRLHRQPAAQMLLEHFWQTIQGGAIPEPSFGDAYRALGLLRAAAQSRAEGRRVAFPVPSRTPT